MVGKKTFVEGGIKLGFAGDKGLAEIKLHIPAAEGYGKLIPDKRPGPGFGKIRARGRFRFLLPVFRLNLGLRPGLGFRLGLNLGLRPGLGFFRLGLNLGLRPGGRGGSGFLGRGKFGNRFTGGKGKQDRPYQEF
jgi:hypothetical protein